MANNFFDQLLGFFLSGVSSEIGFSFFTNRSLMKSMPAVKSRKMEIARGLLKASVTCCLNTIPMTVAGRPAARINHARRASGS